MKKYLIISSVFIAVGSFVWLWIIMPEQGYMICKSGADCQVVARGWYVLKYTWPALLVACVLLTPVVLFVFELTYKLSDRADWQSRVDTAEKRAKEAEEDANTRYAQAIRIAERREEAAYSKHFEYEQAMETAKKQVEIANQKAKEAKFRMKNAICAAERIKRKIEGKKRISVR